MEARKPSRQTANARTKDTKLKSAKPHRVQLRSLAGRAVCGLLSVAALLTLPGQVQAQTTIWSSTLTVRAINQIVLGCGDSTSSAKCTTYLSDNDFTYDRTTFVVTSINIYPTSFLRIIVDENIPATVENLTLKVDGMNFAFDNRAMTSNTQALLWNNREFSWTPGQTVSFTLTDPDRMPGAPETPTAPALGATEGSNTSLDMGWLTPASAGPFVNYYIRYHEQGQVIWITGSHNFTTNFARISGLTAGTTYKVQVLASNNNGDSDWSPSGTGRTDSGTKPNAPTNLTATAHGEDRIDLNWTAPSNNGDSDIRSYKIEVRSDASNWLVLVRTTGTADTEYSHRDVPAGVRRHYRVSAINTQGTGSPSNEDDATTADAAGGGGGAPTPDPQMQQSQTPLTASFVSVPPTHDGETPFWLELTFDAPVAQGSKPQIQALLDVTGGAETRFRRKNGQLDHWQIRIDPMSDNAVTVMLSPSPACGETGAVCTDDGRTFTTGLATQIHGPASGDSDRSEESAGTAVTPVPALPLAGIGLLGLLLALLGSRRRLNDHRQINTSRPSATEPPDSETA